MRHTPMERFGWEQLVRRAELAPTTKLVALTLATFANPGGGRVRPGEVLLADCCGLRERAVREHMAVLRAAGLIEMVVEGRRGRASVYQLTIPGAGVDPLVMRLDPDGDRLVGRIQGPGGGSRSTTGTPVPVDNGMTGTAVPVNIPDDRHTGAGEPGNDRHPHARLEAPPRTMTGTQTSIDRHTGASHHTDQPRPTKTTRRDLAGYVTYAAATNDKTMSPGERAQDTPADDDHTPDSAHEWHPRDTTYADARRRLDDAPNRDQALTQARMNLAADGQPTPPFRDLVVAAAAILAASGEPP